MTTNSSSCGAALVTICGAADDKYDRIVNLFSLTSRRAARRDGGGGMAIMAPAALCGSHEP